MNIVLPENPCCSCHKPWHAGRGCDCSDTCTDITAYTRYRERIAAEVEAGMSLEDAVAKINRELGKGA